MVLRPRRLNEVLDLALRFSSQAARGLNLRLAAWVLLPCWLVCLGLRYGLELHWAWVWIAAWALSVTAQGVFTVAAGRLVFAPSLSVREVRRHFVGRLPAYLGMLALTGLAFWASGVFLVVPIFVWIRTAYAYEAVLLEQAGPGQAFKRAGRFIRNRGGETFMLVSALLVAQALTTVGVEMMLNQGVVDWVLQLGAPFGTLFDDGGSPFALLGYFLSVPFVATARFLAYIDQRTRQDGWDVQLAFLRIKSEATGTAPDLGPGSPR